MKQETIDNLKIICESIEQSQLELNTKIKGLFQYIRGLCSSKEQAREEQQKHAEASEQNSEDSKMKYKNVKIYQRGDNKLFYARIPLGNNKYLTVYSSTQIGCYGKLKNYLDSPRSLQNKVKALPTFNFEKKVEKKQITFIQFYWQWLELYKIPACKKSSILLLKSKFKNWLSSTEFAQKSLKEITTLDLQKFISSLVSFPRMARQLFFILTDIFGKAEILEIITKNPMRAMIAPKYRAKEKNSLTKQEEIDFVKIAKNNRYWVIYALMLYEGLRTAEAKAIRHCDIKDDYIVVDIAIDAVGNFTTTKTESSVRKIPIFAQFKPLADELRSDSKEKLIVGACKNTANRDYVKIAEEANIKYNMYCLRHTFITRCDENGISPKQAQLWAGHSDIVMTLKCYTNINKEYEKINIEKKQ